MTDPAKAGQHGKPILFSAPMVRALLAGTKTQTRRIITQRGNAPSLFDGTWSDSYVLDPGNASWRERGVRIQPGDRLWVREAWAPLDALTHGDPGVTALADRGFYRADNSTMDGEISRWRPSIHLPRWASRLTLIVTDVRVQRLQNISEEDARAEGCDQALADAIMEPEELAVFAATHILAPRARARIIFETLWEQINGAGSWAANPWVAAYTFTVHHQNIDALPLPAARDAAKKEGGA